MKEVDYIGQIPCVTTVSCYSFSMAKIKIYVQVIVLADIPKAEARSAARKDSST
jgi:hypothetical protein